MAKIEVRVIDAYVFFRDSNNLKYLLLKRNQGKIYEHLWQGVAGKIEKNEEAWQAALRELNEETGLVPIRIFTADHVSSFYEGKFDRLNLVPVFGIEVKDMNVVLSNEHSSYEWLSFDEAYSRLSWNGQKKGIKTVHEMISGNDERMRWSEIKINLE